MNILIMSDLVPPASVSNSYTEGNLEALVDPALFHKIMSSDLNILNLECPLTTCSRPMEKWGSRLKASPACINLLKRIPNLVVNLANNHIKDYGEEGILETITLLEQNQISYVGAGKNLESMISHIVIPSSEGSVGIFSCTEHEFSLASLKEAGANPFSIGDAIFEIQSLSETCDYVIALYHGGIEFYPYPTPAQQKNLRCLAKAGADLTVCQHSHCIGCLEEYQGRTIIYGQGNFLFGTRPEVEENISDFEMWQKGMLVNINLPAKIPSFSFYTRENGKLCTDTSDTEKEAFRRRSAQLMESGFLETEWTNYCQGHTEYMSIFKQNFGGRPVMLKTRCKQALKMLMGKNPRPDSEYLRIYNYLFCEVHLELLQTLSQLRIKSNTKKGGKNR